MDADCWRPSDANSESDGEIESIEGEGVYTTDIEDNAKSCFSDLVKLIAIVSSAPFQQHLLRALEPIESSQKSLALELLIEEEL